MNDGWPGGQYRAFRAVFGAYLCAHFLGLVAWGPELFSSGGMLPDPTSSPLAFVFPNVLAVIDSAAFVTTLLVLAVVASVLFAFGLRDRGAAVFLWYVWACLLGRNPLISNPGIPYVGWMLLAHAVMPGVPRASLPRQSRLDPSDGWHMPHVIFSAAWVLMAVGYTYSGVTKLASPSWLDGTAVAHILENPLARPGLLREAIVALPHVLVKLVTWATLTLELIFAPLALLRRARPWLWISGLAMHLVLIVLIDFADLSLGMVMLHLFTFDAAWGKLIRRDSTRPGRVGSAPQRRGLCTGL